MAFRRQPLLAQQLCRRGVELYCSFMFNGIYGSQSKPHHNILLHTKETFQRSIGALHYIYNGFCHSATKEVRTPRRAKAEEAEDNDCAATNWIISC
jgi:hypothetical protein